MECPFGSGQKLLRDIFYAMDVEHFFLDIKAHGAIYSAAAAVLAGQLEGSG